MTRVLAITISSQEGRFAFISAENALGPCAGLDTGKAVHMVADGASANDETRIFEIPFGGSAPIHQKTVSIAPGLTARIIDQDLTRGYAYDGPGADLARMLESVPGMKNQLPRLPLTWSSRILSASSGNNAATSAAFVKMPGMKDPIVLIGE